MQAASPQCMHAMETYWTGVGESSLFNSTTCLNRGPRAPGSSCTLGRLLWADLARDLASEALRAPPDVEVECVLHGYLSPLLPLILSTLPAHIV